jgi:hypothetical protein
LFGTQLLDASVVLLEAIAERSKETQQSVEIYLSPSSIILPTLLRLGFRLRSRSAQVVVYARPQSEMAEFLQGGPDWAFNQAEILA